MVKVKVIIVSLLVLIFYLNCGKLQAYFDTSFLGIESLPMENIETLCIGKEDIYMEPEIFFNDESIAYDKEQNMLLIPQNVSKENFEGRLWATDGKLYFLEDEAQEQKDVAIAENKVFRLFWIREDKCWMYNVYFTGMPIIQMTSDEVDEQGVTYGTVEVCDLYHSNSQYQESSGNWHIRGATTLNYEKKSYRLTIDKKLSLLGMREDDDWILHALYDDDGLIHNKLSYEVWQEIAADNNVSNDEGIDMEYVEVFMDNEYLGIYGISERIDKKALNLNDKDILYKCRDYKEPGEDDFYSELTEEMEPGFVLKYPEKIEEKIWEPLKMWTNWFCKEEIYNYDEGKSLLNKENAIDYNLFNLLISGSDNTMKNIYFWADYQLDGSYQFIKIPWDLNMTWGNSWIDDYNCNFNRYQKKNLNATYGWTPDIYDLYQLNPQEIGEMLCDRWQELRANIITKESLYEKVDALIGYLNSSGAYIRERLKWSEKDTYWSYDYIYEYIDKRIDFLDSYIEQLRMGEQENGL